MVFHRQSETIMGAPEQDGIRPNPFDLQTFKAVADVEHLMVQHAAGLALRGSQHHGFHGDWDRVAEDGRVIAEPERIGRIALIGLILDRIQGSSQVDHARRIRTQQVGGIF